MLKGGEMLLASRPHYVVDCTASVVCTSTWGAHTKPVNSQQCSI